MKKCFIFLIFATFSFFGGVNTQQLNDAVNDSFKEASQSQKLSNIVNDTIKATQSQKLNNIVNDTIKAIQSLQLNNIVNKIIQSTKPGFLFMIVCI